MQQTVKVKVINWLQEKLKVSRLQNKAASCDLDGEGGARVSVITPVAANEKLRVRIFKTVGEWLARKL